MNAKLQKTHTNLPILKKEYVFGVDSSVRNGLIYLDDNRICWAINRCVVIHDIHSHVQIFLPCTKTANKITALSICSSHKYLAVAESGTVVKVTIWTIDGSLSSGNPKKKVIVIPDTCKSIISMCFSTNGGYLVAQGGAPQWVIFMLSTEKVKVLASLSIVDQIGADKNFFVHQISLHPTNSSLICVTGNGLREFYNYNNEKIYLLPNEYRNESVKYLAHVWTFIDHKLIVSTDCGDLLLLQKNGKTTLLSISPSDGLSITSLVAYSRGFIASGHMGLATIFEVDTQLTYRKVKTIKVNELQNNNQQGDLSITSLALMWPSEAKLGILTSTKQIYQYDLESSVFSMSNDIISEPLTQKFHTGLIVALDICIQKPFIVTCGKDQMVKLWNYMTKQIEAEQQYSIDMLAVSIHPMGLYICISFIDKLRLMNVYGHEIREFRNYGIRLCNECRFSTGGAIFAVSHYNNIQVYLTYTGELLGVLQGHTGKIKQIKFPLFDDSRLLSVGSDGILCEWNLAIFELHKESSINISIYNTVDCDPDHIITASTDRKIRIYNRSSLVLKVEFKNENFDIKAMAYSPTYKFLFLGYENGLLSVANLHTNLAKDQTVKNSKSGTYKYELKNILDVIHESHPSHQGCITNIVLSYDETILVTTGEDGILQIWNLTSTNTVSKDDFIFTKEVLIENQTLENRFKSITELQLRIQHLKKSIDEELNVQEINHNRKVEELKQTHINAQIKQKKQLEVLTNDKCEQFIQFNEYREQVVARYYKEYNTIAKDYSAKVESLQQLASKINSDIEKLRLDHEIEYLSNLEESKNQLVVLKTKCEDEVKQGQLMIEDLHAKKDRIELEANEFQQGLENIADRELLDLKEVYKDKIEHEKDQCVLLRSQSSLHKLQEQRLKSELDAKIKEVKQQMDIQTQHQNTIKSLEKDIRLLASDLKERVDIIADKESQIVNLQKNNQELEKFKFVLEYKIKELNLQLAPKDLEIQDTQETYRNMSVEAQDYNNNNKILSFSVRNLMLRINSQRKELEELVLKLEKVAEDKDQLHAEILSLYENNDCKSLKSNIKLLNDKYSLKNTLSNEVSCSDTNALKEYNRKLTYLERCIKINKERLVKNRKKAHSSKNRIIRENIVLIKEINELRKEKHYLYFKHTSTINGAGSVAAKKYRDFMNQVHNTEKEVCEIESELSRLKSVATELEQAIHS